MEIDFDFATQDDCLDRMVPSDLRSLVAERDELRQLLGESMVKFGAYHTEGFKAAPVNLMRRIREALERYEKPTR